MDRIQTYTVAGKSAIYFSDAQNGWVTTTSPIGGGTPIRQTTDGTTWTILSLTLPTLNNMRFFDPTYGWAVGEYGTIVRYGTGNVSVDEAISTSLRITPNPVADRVSFNVDAVDQVEIHNATGQLVLRTKGARSSIDVSALPPGCYSIRVAAQGTFRTARFIKE